MNRRAMLKMAAGSAAIGAVGALGDKGAAFAEADKSAALAQTYSRATRGMPALKITNVKTIMTCPEGGNYVCVKVETSEPGLYGVGRHAYDPRRGRCNRHQRVSRSLRYRERSSPHRRYLAHRAM